MTDLIIHIGHNKTGSTSIQRALAEQAERSALEQIDALYRKTGRNAHVHHPLSNFDPRMRKRRGITNNDHMSLWASLQKEIRTSKKRIVVISAESFSSCDPENLQYVSHEYLGAVTTPPQAICYIRPHASMALSALPWRCSRRA